jgi:nucleotide-binding universal stress UspA family protein
MERFKNIAVVYAGDRSDRVALQRASAIAEKNRARLSIIAVIEPIAGIAQLLLGKERVEQFFSGRQQELQAALDKDCMRLGMAQPRLHFLSGTVAVETIRFILSAGCDLLVKTREEPEKNRSISATDKKLLRKCPVPVLLLTDSRKKKFSRILAAVDPDPDVPLRLDLHDNVLKLAVSMAEREQAALDVIHVWDIFSAATLQGPRFKLSAEELKEIIDKEVAMRRSWIDALLAPYAGRGPKIRIHLIQGDPAQTIVDFVGKRKSDLLVMGTVARGGLPGLLIGNTAEGVLDSIDCATLTIKPPDFVSPITP